MVALQYTLLLCGRRSQSGDIPSKTACLDDLLWGQRRPEVRGIIKDKPAELIPCSFCGVYAGLHHVFCPAFHWMVLSADVGFLQSVADQSVNCMTCRG